LIQHVAIISVWIAERHEPRMSSFSPTNDLAVAEARDPRCNGLCTVVNTQQKG
jgi:hypothetical protein